MNRLQLYLYVVPYYCGMKNQTRAYVDCILNPDSINISALIDQTMKYESNGLIDPTVNMFNDQVYIYHGINDTIILVGHTLLLIVI